MIFDLPGHSDEVYAIDWAPIGGDKAISGGKDCLVKIWRHWLIIFYRKLNVKYVSLKYFLIINFKFIFIKSNVENNYIFSI